MPNFEFSPQYKALWDKHIDPRRLMTLHPNWTSESGARFKTQWVKLIAEAEGLKNCDPGAPQVLDLRSSRSRSHRCVHARRSRDAGVAHRALSGGHHQSRHCASHALLTRAVEVVECGPGAPGRDGRGANVSESIQAAANQAGHYPSESTITHAIDRWIYVFMAAFFIAITLTGFVPDSLAKIAAVEAGERSPFPLVLHLHSILMGSFLLLLLVQTVLAARGELRHHQRLGLASVGWFRPLWSWALSWCRPYTISLERFADRPCPGPGRYPRVVELLR